MIPTQPPDRFPTNEACDRLDKEFGFTPHPYCQDWEIELSDGARLQEFVHAYIKLKLNEDERFALMALIVASAHRALGRNRLGVEQWQPIHHLLVAEADLHAPTIYYWCCSDATCLDECFTLSGHLRSVWNEAFPDQLMPPLPAS